MIRKRHVFNESVEDPCELLVSLVDIGAVDIEDAFLACTCEMSPAQCKRVLAKCGSGFACPECNDELPAEAEDMDDIEPIDDEPVDVDDDDLVEDVEDGDMNDEDVEESCSRLESRIRRLERCARQTARRRRRF